MDFIDHTPFSSLAFEGIDQHNQSFHVVVLRQTLSWDNKSKLSYAEQQAPLCEVDKFIRTINQSSLRQESDLCHYKPRCDVIVNAVAHAPKNQAMPRFNVRLTVKRAETDTPLIDKILTVTGSASLCIRSSGNRQPQQNLATYYT